MLFGCQRDSLSGTWVAADGETVCFENDHIVCFDNGTRQKKYYFRILPYGGIEKGYTYWLELSDVKSNRVITVRFENIDNYKYIKIDGEHYKPEGHLWFGSVLCVQ